jgi:hypothetical protein
MMDGSMEINEVWTLCGWFFILGGSMAFGALFGLAVFDLIREVFKRG